MQVASWRMLHALRHHGWSQALLDALYLDEDVRRWAESGVAASDDSDVTMTPTLDGNGTPLATGDNVTLLKDLDVKGGGFTAKRGTMVKQIVLTDNPKHVEGRVNGMTIVLVAAYLKKAN